MKSYIRIIHDQQWNNTIQEAILYHILIRKDAGKQKGNIFHFLVGSFGITIAILNEQEGCEP